MGRHEFSQREVHGGPEYVVRLMLDYIEQEQQIEHE